MMLCFNFRGDVKICAKKLQLVTCPYCSQTVDRNIDKFIKRSGRYYHENCHNEKFAKSQERTDLLDYVAFLYGDSANYQLISKQVKELMEEYNFTLKGIELTLRYFYDIQGNSIKSSKGIGIVPYTYEEAKRYYASIIRITNSAKQHKLESEVEVFCKKERRKNNKRKNIDIGGI